MSFEKQITGIMIYYNEVCKRKLWYFVNSIQMEVESDDVLIGKFLDDDSYNREDKHINIDNVINIDFISSKKILNEVKKSRKMEEASIWQVKYYLYYLRKKGAVGIKGKIDYPLLKRSLDVELLEQDIIILEQKIKDIYNIINGVVIPERVNSRICKLCAYYDLCYI